MERKTRSQILEAAKILPNFLQPQPLSKQERLTLWAEALEREGSRRLRTLHEIEYAPRGVRENLRAPDSPLSVAFADERLRGEGLLGDAVGDATAFFGISEMELHDILCFCHFGETMSAEGAAARVRIAARQAEAASATSRGLTGSLRAALTAVLRPAY